jgi:hypothetical protein
VQQGCLGWVCLRVLAHQVVYSSLQCIVIIGMLSGFVGLSGCMQSFSPGTCLSAACLLLLIILPGGWTPTVCRLMLRSDDTHTGCTNCLSINLNIAHVLLYSNSQVAVPQMSALPVCAWVSGQGSAATAVAGQVGHPSGPRNSQTLSSLRLWPPRLSGFQQT